MDNNKKEIISIVVPVYFEEEVILETYKRLKKVVDTIKYNYEIIFVDDGSQDNTFNIINNICKDDNKVKCIKFSRNFGHQCAVTAGIIDAVGLAVILIDADLQDPPELIPDMIDMWEKGVEVVYGKRQQREGETAFKKSSAKLFYKFLGYMSDIDIPRDTGDFRLMDRKVVDAFKNMPEKNRFIRGMVSWVGFQQKPIMYQRDKRYAGETKYPLKKMIKFASNGIISFSTKPLKLFLYIGAVSVFISFLILVYAFYQGIIRNEELADGWASLMVTITFIGGMNLMSIGVLGSYIGRIYEESKNRPLYIVESKINFDGDTYEK